jgi:hypothetical protein
MKLDLRRSRLWPCVFAVIFFSMPPLLFYWYPSSLWTGSDYQPHGLADALNMAYRLADHRMYFARGMLDHPGVPFYFTSWLALALAGYPVASQGSGFFNTVIEHVEDFHQVTVWLAASVGAIGVYVFARAAQKLVPIGVVAIGLLVWLASTPTTLLMFVGTSIESFAILINALFFVVLVRLAYDRDLTAKVAFLCGCVGAFAYLNKLSYIYIPVALAVAGIANVVWRRAGGIRARQLSLLFASGYLLVLLATAVFIIGWDGFLILVRFHLRVMISSGMYGNGDRVVVSKDEIWQALAALPVDRAYAILIALVGGPCLAIGGFLTGRRGPEHVPVALISLATGTASFLSAIFVLKHYGIHYTAGVSATLPASVAAGYLLAKSWGWDYRFRIVATALAATAILFMADQTRGWLIPALAARTNTSQLAQADMQEIRARLAGNKRAVEFGYRAPFSGYGEGFVIYYGSVPRMTDDYVQSRQQMFSSMSAELIHREVGAYVLDKAVFPTVESIKTAANIVPNGPEPVTFKQGDEIIELRTVFLLIPG